MSVCEISIRRRVGFDLARCRKFKRTGAGGATPAAAIRATESHPGGASRGVCPRAAGDHQRPRGGTPPRLIASGVTPGWRVAAGLSGRCISGA